MMNAKRLIIVSFGACLLIFSGVWHAEATPFSISEAFIDSVHFNFSGSGFIGRSSSAFSRVELTPIDGIADDQETTHQPGFIDPSKTGSLSVWLEFAPGEKGRFDYATTVYAGASNVVPIPEPSTILLLGTGIIGIVGIGRRKLGKTVR